MKKEVFSPHFDPPEKVLTKSKPIQPNLLDITELKAILLKQDILKIPKNAYQLYNSYDTSIYNSDFFRFCDLYNYGFIMGQIAERKRKKQKGV